MANVHSSRCVSPAHIDRSCGRGVWVVFLRKYTYEYISRSDALVSPRQIPEAVRQAQLSGDTETLSLLGRKGAEAKKFPRPRYVPGYRREKREIFQRAVAEELKAQ